MYKVLLSYKYENIYKDTKNSVQNEGRSRHKGRLHISITLLPNIDLKLVR